MKYYTMTNNSNLHHTVFVHRATLVYGIHYTGAFSVSPSSLLRIAEHKLPRVGNGENLTRFSKKWLHGACSNGNGEVFMGKTATRAKTGRFYDGRQKVAYVQRTPDCEKSSKSILFVRFWLEL